MLTENIFPKNIWGPCAWYLLHMVSIGDCHEIKESYKKNYLKFFTSFGYILPCIICAEHYKNITGIYHKINMNLLSREYIIKWVFDFHNIVNKNLGKKNFTFKEFTDTYMSGEKISNEKILFFVDNVYLNAEYSNMSMYKYEQYHTFFINFVKLYPDKNVRKIMKTLIKKDNFKKIDTPMEFEIWYNRNYKKWNSKLLSTGK